MAAMVLTSSGDNHRAHGRCRDEQILSSQTRRSVHGITDGDQGELHECSQGGLCRCAACPQGLRRLESLYRLCITHAQAGQAKSAALRNLEVRGGSPCTSRPQDAQNWVKNAARYLGSWVWSGELQCRGLGAESAWPPPTRPPRILTSATYQGDLAQTFCSGAPDPVASGACTPGRSIERGNPTPCAHLRSSPSPTGRRAVPFRGRSRGMPVLHEASAPSAEAVEGSKVTGRAGRQRCPSRRNQGVCAA